MSFLARRTGAVLLVLVGLLASLVLTGVGPASAASGKAVGQVFGTQSGAMRIQMLWFDKDWHYLGKRTLDRSSAPIYTVSLQPGTYHLQFIDLRPAYDVTKYAPRDIQVTVKSGTITQHDVKMRRGAAITGTAFGGDHKPLGGARVVAASPSEQSFGTKANGKGQFAIGGLPDGNFSVFTFDRDAVWVGKSLWVAKMRRPEVRNITIRLTTRGGSLLTQLKKPDGSKMGGRFYVTAISRSTGQFWTARASNGSVTFQGLYPGRYKMVAPGVGDYLAHTGGITGSNVKPSRADLASTFRWTQHGAWVVGIVVDYEDPSYPLEGAAVALYDRYGNKLDEDLTNANGQFYLHGQLTTQDGLKVVAQPGGYTAYLGKGTHYCKYGRATSDPFGVTTGQETDAGAVELPHLPAAQQDGAQCYPSDGS